MLLLRRPRSFTSLTSLTSLMPSFLRSSVSRPTVSRAFTAATPPPTPKAVRIVEVSCRDGLQNESATVALQTKLSLLERLSAAGLTHLEAGSFVSPKWVPQMSDTSQVLSSLESLHSPSPGTVYSYLVPNSKGLEGFLSHSASPERNEIAVFASASEGFSKKNLNATVDESLQMFSRVVEKALEQGYRVRGYVSMIVSCPYSGPTPPANVAKVVSALLDMGCYEVSLGDTNGVATPATLRALFHHLIQDRHILPEKLAAHFHDTYGMAIVNCLVALEAGIRTFDGSVGGLGGCPYAKGATGNVATEDLVWFLEGVGCKTGVELGKLVETGRWICGELGKENGSRVGRAWPEKGKI